MHVEVTMHERKLVCGQSETKEHKGKTIDKRTLETYEEYFVSCSGLGSID